MLRSKKWISELIEESEDCFEAISESIREVRAEAEACCDLSSFRPREEREEVSCEESEDRDLSRL